MDYKCAKGRDSDGIPYDEYDFTPPALNEGDRYLRTLVDTRNNTLAHIALVVRNKHECTGNLVVYVTTRRGLFIHRLLVAGEEISFVCAFPDELDPRRIQQIRDTAKHYLQQPLPESLYPIIEQAKKDSDNGISPRSEFAERRRWIGERHVPRLDINDDDSITELLKGVDKTSPAYLAAHAVLSSKAIIDPERPNLDFDGDDPIRPRVATNPLTNLTLEEVMRKLENASEGGRAVALERWVHEQGGLYNVLRRYVDLAPLVIDEIPQIVPTPGSQEMTNQANMDVAQKLCQPVIIDERNYGRLAVSNVGGIPFVGDVDDLAELGLPAIYLSKTPKFNRDIALFVNWKVGEQTNFCPLYALEKEDINDLGRLLSKRGNKVQANFMSANLKIWENGEVTQEYKSPEEFFACNAEWIEQAKF
jgi:hypothetical protein